MGAARSNTAERQRRYRQRQRRCETVYRVIVPDNVLIAMQMAGRLTDEDTLSRESIEAELSGLLADWARYWRD